MSTAETKVRGVFLCAFARNPIAATGERGGKIFTLRKEEVLRKHDSKSAGQVPCLPFCYCHLICQRSTLKL